MKRKEINVQTGEEKIVDLTAEEVAAIEARAISAEATRLVDEQKKAKKASGKAKLKELGLDDDEIKALTGK